ncbi:hypothetical protein PR003_g26966 [Phytophthora rubi]|uniref:Uncharacterized protein n=1 Tax=Phytophthora rubi TaxID=129364 RepID=A0A6A3I9X7_9STRA|nr:hypothetical protein PR002_g25893 [Phytophthora rubi]KAE8977178.1 hypothetical protein PR001_g25204 [Phytophthora rubi]KAE9284028.1 hypothetical protein PR003_g26966 [Phytophthora rubi]
MNTTARLYNSERDVWTTKRANLLAREHKPPIAGDSPAMGAASSGKQSAACL